MKRPPDGTPQWAARVCINSLGADHCGELCGVSPQTVYRWADHDADVQCPLRHALVLDRAAWVRDSITPFREVFEANAGEPFDLRVARQLRNMADNLSGATA